MAGPSQASMLPHNLLKSIVLLLLASVSLGATKGVVYEIRKRSTDSSRKSSGAALTISPKDGLGEAAFSSDPRMVGGDGVVFHFRGRRDKDFCLITDPALHVNAHFIGRNDHHHHRELTWIGSLSIMFGGNQILVGTYHEALWDPFLDHLVLRYNGQELYVPAPGYKSGPHAVAGVWESAGVHSPRVRIVRRRVNDARIEIEGLMDLRVRADAAQRQLWTDDSSFVHLDVEFRQLHVSPAVHGLLGQTYRAARIRAAHARKMANTAELESVDAAVLGHKKNAAIAGKQQDYITSGLWAADCKFSKFRPGGVKGEAGERADSLMHKGEDVNPLEAYFSENAVSIVRRSRISSSKAAMDDFVGNTGVHVDYAQQQQSNEELGKDDGYVIDIDSEQTGAAMIEGADADLSPLLDGATLQELLNE
eukprot:TRINITY_DN4973_c0_g1_i2.p1 TRINITY_DN4973_c0_g1~~TRINITY_DN4973_c0_g1_i2.p1  ORF type:complete len:421 (+),score=92.47 TRINITY_DN4973_c0_g1_i2:177-1439(+)